MKGIQRLQLAFAVFLLFGTLGPVSALANGVIDITSWTMLAVMTGTSGALSVAIVLSLRRPWSLVIIIPVFMFAIRHNSDIAGAISGKEESLTESISAPVVVTPDQFNDIKRKKITVYTISAIMVGLGWTMFVIVINTEGRKRGRIEAEMNIARDIQQSLLPQKPMHVPGCSVYGKTVPASEVGGDYFDFLDLGGGKVAVVIADVAGHGVGAGIIAAMTKSALYLQTAKDPAPSQIMSSLNEALAQITDRKTFVTCAYMLVSLTDRSLQFATAGHPGVLKKSTSGDISELRTKNLALGVKQGVKFEEAHLDLAAGDTFLLYTDGISESTNPGGQAFGTEGIADALKAGVDHSQLCDQLILASRTFSGVKEFKDDATVVCVSISG